MCVCLCIYFYIYTHIYIQVPQRFRSTRARAGTGEGRRRSVSARTMRETARTPRSVKSVCVCLFVCIDRYIHTYTRSIDEYISNVHLHIQMYMYTGTVKEDGTPQCAGRGCYLIHADMLHEAPLCMGIGTHSQK